MKEFDRGYMEIYDYIIKSKSSNLFRDDVKDWLKENVGRCSEDWDWYPYLSKDETDIGFRDSKAAMMFALRWS